MTRPTTAWTGQRDSYLAEQTAVARARLMDIGSELVLAYAWLKEARQAQPAAPDRVQYLERLVASLRKLMFAEDYKLRKAAALKAVEVRA